MFTGLSAFPMTLLPPTASMKRDSIIFGPPYDGTGGFNGYSGVYR
jgi:hypothetical protein